MSQLAKIEDQLNSAPSLRKAMTLDFVVKKFVENYEAMTGRKDGEKRFESELFALMELANDNPDIQKCDRFSFFAALIKAGATGCSFRDGKLYAIPYGKTLKVQISTHGKRELLERMPNVKRVWEGQVVMAGDSFEHDKLNNRIVTHVSKNQAKLTLQNIIASYVRIQMNDNTNTDVVVYQEDILKARSKSKMKNGGPWEEFPGEMAKKVAYNRAFKLYHHYPENVVVFGGEEEDDVEEGNYTVMQSKSLDKDDQPDNFMQPDAPKETVDTETGEVTVEKQEKRETPDSFM